MKPMKSFVLGAVAAGALTVSSGAFAQWPVIDVNAIGQLLRQISMLEQEVQTAERTLMQAEQQYQAITGPRGMQNLLFGVNRNYLPTNFTQLWGAGSSTGTYVGLGVAGLMASNAVLTPQQVSALPVPEQTYVQSGRQSAALLQGTTRQALDTTSARFNELQALVSAIATAKDAKAALDLQARIQAEQAMLQNEHTKLMVLYQTLQAQEWARQQSAREQVIAGVGSLRTLPPLTLQ